MLLHYLINKMVLSKMKYLVELNLDSLCLYAQKIYTGSKVRPGFFKWNFLL